MRDQAIPSSGRITFRKLHNQSIQSAIYDNGRALVQESWRCNGSTHLRVHVPFLNGGFCGKGVPPQIKKSSEDVTHFFSFKQKLRKGVVLRSATSFTEQVTFEASRAQGLAALHHILRLGGAWKFFDHVSTATTTLQRLAPSLRFSGGATLVLGIYSAATGEVCSSSARG